MSDNIPLDKEKIELLKHMELIQRKELHNRRDAEFKIFTWSTNILLALIGVLLILKPSENPFWASYGVLGKLITSASVLLITVFSAQWQTRYRKYRDQNASVITKIDELLQFYEKGYFVPNEALFPESWSDYGSVKFNLFTRVANGVNNTSATFILGILAIAMIWLA